MIYKPRKFLSTVSFLQFPTLTGFLSLFELIAVTTLVLNIKLIIFRKRQLLFLLLIATLFILQTLQIIYFQTNVVISWFLIKYASILLCFLIFILIGNCNFDYSVSYIITPLTLSVLFAIYAAPSYIFGYTEFLPPGICESNNINYFTGHLRCGSFGEGNYFGIYLILIAIAFHRFGNVYLLCFLGILISSSLVALFLIFYLGLRYWIKLPFKVFVFAGALATIYTVFYLDIVQILLTGQGIPERTSFGERLEFIRISIRAFGDYPIVGVGAGQYSQYVGDYTNFAHLIEGSRIPDIRFISNNVISEMLSEFGAIGLFVYLYFVIKVSSMLVKLNHFSKLENIGLILITGIAQPTFFILSNMIIFGLIAAQKERKSD